MRKQLLLLFSIILMAGCSKESVDGNEGPSIDNLNEIETINKIMDGVASLSPVGEQPQIEKITGYLQNEWSDKRMNVRDSIINLTINDSITLYIDVYGKYITANSDWSMDEYEIANEIDSIMSVLGRNTEDNTNAVHSESIFTDDYTSLSREFSSSTRANNANDATILVNNNILVWAPWYETESEYERSLVYRTINNLTNTINKSRPPTQYVHLVSANGPTLADLSSMKQFNIYDVVFIDCHGTENGELVMPLTKKIEKFSGNPVQIWDINRNIWVKGKVIKEKNIEAYLPTNLDHTILFTAMCYAYSSPKSQSIFRKIAQNKKVADFMGATNKITIKQPLEKFVEFYKNFSLGGTPTTAAFNNGGYTASYKLSDGQIAHVTGEYLHGRALSDVFYGYSTPLPYNKSTKSLRGRMPVPQSLVSKKRTRQIIQRLLTRASGFSEDVLQAGFILKNLTNNVTNIIPLSAENVRNYQLYPYGNMMTDVVYEVETNLEAGNYAYCTYIWNGETLKLSPQSQKFTIEEEDGEAYAVLKDGTLTYYYDNKKEKREGEVGWGNDKVLYLFSREVREKTNKVVFDYSFASYTPTNSFGQYLFNNWKDLKVIKDLKYLNTSNMTDMSDMFSGCESLTSIDLSNFNLSNVTDISNMFDGCSSLTNLDLSNFNTSNVTNVSSMFRGCSSLTNLDLSSFNTSNVTNMSGLFWGCSSLTNLDLSSLDTSNVTDISYMFKDCSSLNNLDLTNFYTINVTNASSMFEFCSGLITIYACNWDLTNAKSENMFFICDKLVGGKGTHRGYNLYGYDKNENPLYYECPDDGRAAHIDGGKDNPGLFTAK